MGKTIEIRYESGDSFSSGECKTQIPLVFNNKDALINALYSIFEHNEYYQKIDSHSVHPSEKDRLYNEMKSKKWFYSTLDEINSLDEDVKKKLTENKQCKQEIENIQNGNITWREDSYWEYYIYIYDDNNNRIKINVFWCGYFEKFYDAKIVND